MVIGTSLEIAALLSCACLASFVLIFSLMKRKYIRTFFSGKLGKTVIMEKFKNSEDDDVKAIIFKKNRKCWVEIEGDVKHWVQANYWRWKRDKPEWFTEKLIKKIPVNFIPEEEESRRGVIGAGRTSASVAPAIDR
jgi:hypothetical protein